MAEPHYERRCPRCGRVCFDPDEFHEHDCFDMEAKLDAAIAEAGRKALSDIPDPKPDREDQVLDIFLARAEARALLDEHGIDLTQVTPGRTAAAIEQMASQSEAAMDERANRFSDILAWAQALKNASLPDESMPIPDDGANRFPGIPSPPIPSPPITAPFESEREASERAFRNRTATAAEQMANRTIPPMPDYAERLRRREPPTKEPEKPKGPKLEVFLDENRRRKINLPRGETK